MSEEGVRPTNTDPQFWNERWNKNEIGFHQANNNQNLVKHLNKLVEDNKHIRILFPFCGKAVDMSWLASLGHEVVGVEYVQMACEKFFAENNIKHNVSEVQGFKLFTSEDGKIKIYNGSFFDFTTEHEKPFECVWDRGAYGALHYELRVKYSTHMKSLLAPKVRYLLDVFDYDTSLYPGPPHACKKDEITNLYGSEFKFELLESDQYQAFNQKLADVNQPHVKLYFLTRN
ncbi:unnamed protein product [Brachionus calyciflorus]|uniref:thiopurine S-methyltransferase n=1 Tax=Brachionus calyciflorus TaxID=104777 RepID=A0A814GEG5_9BILA|nr:unnamed protein product [Brachionus calyciflorus]